MPGHRVVAALVVEHINPARVHVLKVRHFVGFGFQDQVFLDPNRYIAGRRHNNVEAMATSLDLGQGGVVGIIVRYGHFDLMLGFELFDQFRIGVVAPVEDVEFTFRKSRCAEGQQGRSSETSEFQFHNRRLPFLVSVASPLPPVQEEKYAHQNHRDRKKHG